MKAWSGAVLVFVLCVAGRWASAADAVLASIEQQSVAAAAQLERVQGESRAAQAHVVELEIRTAELLRALDTDRQRVLLSTASEGPVSTVLLRHQAELESARSLKVAQLRAQQQAAEAEIRQLDLSDQIAELRDPMQAAEVRRRQMGGAGSATLEEIAAALMRLRQEQWEPLLQARTALTADLARVAKAQAQLAEVVGDYRQFINAQVLWLPNETPIHAEEAADAVREFTTLVAPAFWQEVMAGARASMREFPLRWLVYVAVLVAAVVYRPRFVKRLRALGHEVGGPSDRFLNSGQALVLTVLCAAPLPATLAIVGALLQASPESGSALSSLVNALDSIESLVLLCSIQVELARPGGLAESHFGWRPNVLNSLKKGARLVLHVAVPLIFVSVLAAGATSDLGGAPLGRVALLAALLVLGFVSVHLFKPSNGLFSAVIANRPRGWIALLRGLWYPLLVAIPFALALGAAMGYVFTTRIILENMIQTYWVILGIAVGLALLDRLFQSTSDRFAWRRGTSSAEQKRLGEQVGRVIRLMAFLVLLVGIAAAWNNVVPALGLMKSSTLWTVGAEDGSLKAVTVRDLLVFALVIALTVQLVRDLPGVLGLALLQRFPLDDSARYAIVSLGRYVLVLAGIGASFAALKIGWSNVQWLAAAVTVGLGFGLQEIFANFVSGLIMLAERPVRLGDIVTVDNVTGRVVKIATRATTLVDFDEKEIIVPNKQFITTRITNWTLDDGPIRYTVAVGVEYGTDLELAERTLNKALVDLPMVVPDPAPMAVLRQFGASSIDFDVLYYVVRPRESIMVRHTLIGRIDKLFREQGIVIAFPQLDVHVKSAPVVPPR